MHKVARLSAAKLLCISLGLMYLSAQPALAADWKWGARTGLVSVYDDNPALTDDDRDPESTFRFLGFVDMDFENVGPQKGFTISPRISRDYYPDSSKKDLESTDYDIPGSAFYALPTVRFGVSYGYKRQNILSSETLAEANGNPQNFRADDLVYNYNVNPSIIWSPTLKDQFQIAGGWSKQDYDLDYTGRSDFEGYSFISTYLRSITPRQSLGVTGTFQSSESEGRNCIADFLNIPRPPSSPPCDDFDNSNPPRPNATNKNESDNYSATVDYTYRWSDTLEFRGSIGRTKTKQTQKALDENGNTLLFDSTLIGDTVFFVPVEKRDFDSDGDTFNISVTKRTDRSDINLSAKRSTVLQSSTGSPQDTDDYRLTWDTKITKRFAVDTTFQYQERTAAALESDDNNSGASRKRRFYSAEVVMRYNLSRDWSLVTNYRYRKRDNDSSITNPNADNIISTSNQFRVGINYTFKKIR